MEEKVNEKVEKEIPPLPERRDPFWKGAQQDVFTLGKSVVCESDHFWIRVGGMDARCRDCPMGTMLGAQNEVVNGRILLHGSHIA